jgi:Ser/Thr protein kinase RdoA (MazF antagonist)
MDIRESVLRHYGLVVSSLDLMSTGRVNRTYKLCADDGNTYCLKVYSDAVTDKRLYDGLEVTSYLIPLGFPVPRVVPTAAGDLVLVVDRLRLLLLRFLPGRNLALDEVGSAEGLGMGAMLGKLHHSLRFFPQADKLHNSLWRGSEESLPRLFDLLTTVQSKDRHDDFDYFTISSLTYRIQVMQGVDVGPRQFFHLRRQAIHGDYQLGNVLFDAYGTVAGVLDFDQTCYSFPAWELMRAIGFTCLRDGKFNYPLAAAMLKGYRDGGGMLAPSEYLEMPRLWYYQLVRGLFGFSDHYAGTPDPRQDEAAYGRHHAMVWLGQNMAELRAFIWDTTRH